MGAWGLPRGPRSARTVCLRHKAKTGAAKHWAEGRTDPGLCGWGPRVGMSVLPWQLTHSPTLDTWWVGVAGVAGPAYHVGRKDEDPLVLAAGPLGVV